MYKIGQFSKITSFTIKTLRYYDQESLLSPSIRDQNQYRLYSEKDYLKALDIKMLKSFDVIEKTIKPLYVSYIAYKDAYHQTGKYFKLLYKAIHKYVVGPPMNIYHDGSYKEIASIESLVPIHKVHKNVSVNVKILPEINALSLMYTGRYEEIHKAYIYIFDYAIKNHLTLCTPSREIYHKGPGLIFKGNPNHYITEIQMPYTKKTVT